MLCYLYIIRCRDNSYYTGITNNLSRRLNEHNQRIKSCLQKSKIPVILVYKERFLTRMEAAEREKVIKGWSRKKKEILINSFN
jgi:putative endonuclease